MEFGFAEMMLISIVSGTYYLLGKYIYEVCQLFCGKFTDSDKSK